MLLTSSTEVSHSLVRVSVGIVLPAIFMCPAICQRSGAGRFLVAEVKAIEDEDRLNLVRSQKLNIVVKNFFQAIWKSAKRVQEWLMAGLVESKVKVVGSVDTYDAVLELFLHPRVLKVIGAD
jgi:hypothetical protein